MADEPPARSESHCSNNSRVLELPDEMLRKLFCFLSDNSSELDKNPLLPLREVCKVLRSAVDDNLSTLACFTKFSVDNRAAWLARVQEQIRRMLPKWPALRRLRWHLLLHMADFKALLEAIASTRPDLRELELLPDCNHWYSVIASDLKGWIPHSHLSPLTSFRSLQTLTIRNVHPFNVHHLGLELPALPSLQVLRLEDPCPLILGALPALRELQLSWSRIPGGRCAVKMRHLAQSTRLARVSLDGVELERNLQFPGSLESLRLHRTDMDVEGSLHIGKELVHLTDLDLNCVGMYEPVDGNSFANFMRVARLRSLKLDCTSFIAVPDLSFQTGLTALTLRGNWKYALLSRPAVIFPELAPLRSLRRLKVAGFEEKKRLDLHGLCALEQLSIYSCASLSALVGLEDLTRLQNLSLSHLALGNSCCSPVNLGALLALETLVLRLTSFRSGCSVPPSLTRLEYSDYTDIDSKGVQEMFSLPSDVDIVVEPLHQVFGSLREES